MAQQTWTGIEALRQRPIEHALLKTYHDLIEELLRLVGHGLIFAPDAAAFFAGHCDRVVAKLLGCLRQTYGSAHPGLVDQPNRGPWQFSCTFRFVATLQALRQNFRQNGQVPWAHPQASNRRHGLGFSSIAHATREFGIDVALWLW